MRMAAKNPGMTVGDVETRCKIVETVNVSWSP